MVPSWIARPCRPTLFRMPSRAGATKYSYYDALGRTTKEVQNYTGAAEGSANDVATEYSYDGLGHVLAVQADLPGGAYQRTQYVYGVSTASGSAVNSNDLLAATQWPDPTTGNPSATQQETITPAAASQLVFTQSPATGSADNLLSPQPRVTVEDQFGNTVTGDSSTVNLSIKSGTPTTGGPGSLTGCSQSESNGVTHTTGPKISSWKMRILGITSANTVGAR